MLAFSSGVVARLDRATQYSETAVMESRGCGVLDSPPSRGMTAECGLYPFFLTSLTFVNSMPAARSLA
ncbi:hypothetical protein ABIF68_005697 [Bradyrhizobium japonicum]|nr:hypothetical protein [Bradyrhizobium japonicum]